MNKGILAVVEFSLLLPKNCIWKVVWIAFPAW